MVAEELVRLLTLSNEEKIVLPYLLASGTLPPSQIYYGLTNQILLRLIKFTMPTNSAHTPKSLRPTLSREEKIVLPYLLASGTLPPNQIYFALDSQIYYA